MRLIGFGGAATSLFALAVLSQSAFALDGKDFGEKFAAMFAANGMAITYATSVAEGDSVTMSGVTFSADGVDDADDAAPKNPTTLQFTGVNENSKGGYEVKRATADDIEAADEEMTLSIRNIVVEDMVVPAEPFADALDSLLAYKHFSLGPIVATAEGEEVFSLDSVVVNNLPNSDMSAFTSDYKISGIHADLTKIDEQEAQMMLMLFDLQTVDAEMQGKMDWSLDDGHLTVQESSVTVDKVGRFDFTGEVWGYDLELVSDMLAIQKDMVSRKDMTMEEEEALGLSMFDAMVAKMSLGRLAIRFDDDGITGKVLDFVAQQQGASRDVLVAGLSAALPAMAAQAGLPEATQTMLLKAVSTYLGDPKSLEITSAPANPVPFKDVVEAVGTEDPANLVNLLELKVTANQ